MLFKPDFCLHSVTDIDETFLNNNNIKGLILDLDNTLSLHGSPVEEVGVVEWLSLMRTLGVRMVVLSNNTKKRVEPLAQKLSLEFIAFGAKPLPWGVSRAVKKLNLNKNEICVTGDQIFTDILAGKLSGVRTILVEPFELETQMLMRFKRKIEKNFR